MPKTFCANHNIIPNFPSLSALPVSPSVIGLFSFFSDELPFYLFPWFLSSVPPTPLITAWSHTEKPELVVHNFHRCFIGLRLKKAFWSDDIQCEKKKQDQVIFGSVSISVWEMANTQLRNMEPISTMWRGVTRAKEQIQFYSRSLTFFFSYCYHSETPRTTADIRLLPLVLGLLSTTLKCASTPETGQACPQLTIYSHPLSFFPLWSWVNFGWEARYTLDGWLVNCSILFPLCIITKCAFFCIVLFLLFLHTCFSKLNPKKRIFMLHLCEDTTLVTPVVVFWSHIANLCIKYTGACNAAV